MEHLRVETHCATAIPYFDPFDGGTTAKCLFLLEAPGPKALRDALSNDGWRRALHFPASLGCGGECRGV